MTNRFELERPPSYFGRFLVASVMLHAVLLGALFFWYDIFNRPKAPNLVMQMELVKLGKKPEETLMPRKRTIEKEVPKEPIAQERSAPKPEVKPEPKQETQTPQKHQLTKKKEAPQKESKKVVKKTVSPLETLKQRLKKIDNGQPGGSEMGQSLKSELADTYQQHIQEMIKENFLLPGTLNEAERRRLRAIVFLKIGATGSPTYVEIRESSGNLQFDNAVLARINAIESFGPPPLPLVSTYATQGLKVEYCPISCAKE